MTSTTGTTSEAGPWVRVSDEDDDRSIDQFELVAARRALALLKGGLGRERLLDLLHDETAAGSAYLRTHVERSEGQETTGTTTLRAHGITSGQFAGWLARAFAREDVLLAAHPEHYSIHAAGGRVTIVETLGPHVCSFSMRAWDEAATSRAGAETRTSDPDEAPGRRSHMVLEDGTVVGSILNSFHHAEDGFRVRLSVTLPATCGPDAVEHHLEHFAVEYRSWIRTAAAEQVDGR